MEVVISTRLRIEDNLDLFLAISTLITNFLFTILFHLVSVFFAFVLPTRRKNDDHKKDNCKS